MLKFSVRSCSLLGKTDKFWTCEKLKSFKQQVAEVVTCVGGGCELQCAIHKQGPVKLV